MSRRAWPATSARPGPASGPRSNGCVGQALGNVEQNVDQKVRKTVDQSYDSTEQRGKRDAAREEAGVPLEYRLIATADQMNAKTSHSQPRLAKHRRPRPEPQHPSRNGGEAADTVGTSRASPVAGRRKLVAVSRPSCGTRRTTLVGDGHGLTWLAVRRQQFPTTDLAGPLLATGGRCGG